MVKIIGIWCGYDRVDATLGYMEKLRKETGKSLFSLEDIEKMKRAGKNTYVCFCQDADGTAVVRGIGSNDKMKKMADKFEKRRV